jgi:hypothetical protein
VGVRWGAPQWGRATYGAPRLAPTTPALGFAPGHATGTPSTSLKLRKSYIKPGSARKNRQKTGDLWPRGHQVGVLSGLSRPSPLQRAHPIATLREDRDLAGDHLPPGLTPLPPPWGAGLIAPASHRHQRVPTRCRCLLRWAVAVRELQGYVDFAVGVLAVSKLPDAAHAPQNDGL